MKGDEGGGYGLREMSERRLGFEERKRMKGSKNKIFNGKKG